MLLVAQHRFKAQPKHVRSVDRAPDAEIPTIHVVVIRWRDVVDHSACCGSGAGVPIIIAGARRIVMPGCLPRCAFDSRRAGQPRNSSPSLDSYLFYRYRADVARVLVTGMSGAGKTTVLNELHQRGFITVDTDYGDWELSNGTWDEPRMDELLARHSDLIVSGTVDNQGRFYDRFHHVVLLSAPLEVHLQRVTDRANPYGRTPEQRAETAEYVRTVEPLLRQGATVELDGRQKVSELADAIEKLVREVH
jgi:shikimate kinase